MEKSVLVEVKRLVKHPLYRKYVRRRTKLMAHDAENTARLGDHVELIETRPLSKRKSWRIVRILEAGGGVVTPIEESGVAEIAPTESQGETPPEAETVSTEDTGDAVKAAMAESADTGDAATEEEAPTGTPEGEESS